LRYNTPSNDFTGAQHMGLFDGVMGNASKIDAAKIQDEFSRILAPGEVVEHAYLSHPG